MTRSVLLADPNLEHRQEIARNLGGAKLQLAAEAASPEEAMHFAATVAPDVALIAAFTNGDGAHLAERLFTEHGLPAVLLASPSEALPLTAAAPAGVMGLLVEPVLPSTLSRHGGGRRPSAPGEPGPPAGTRDPPADAGVA